MFDSKVQPFVDILLAGLPVRAVGSRYGAEPADALDVGLPPNAECTDCGAAYSKADDDPTTWCDACSDRRDAWAAAFEIRQMVKAVLTIDLSTVKDVA